MRTILLNSAEAVFAPFFDPALAELADWTVDAPGAQGLRVTQSWAFVIVNWERAASDGLVFRLHRDYVRLDCSAYDRLLVCLNLPEDSVIHMAAETDAGPRRRTGRAAGPTRHEEWLPLEGAKFLTSLTIEVRHPGTAAASAWLLWLGFQHSERLPFHLAQWTGYDERWEKYLQPPGFTPSFTPTYGLLINAQELEEVRREFADIFMGSV